MFVPPRSRKLPQIDVISALYVSENPAAWHFAHGNEAHVPGFRSPRLCHLVARKAVRNAQQRRRQRLAGERIRHQPVAGRVAPDVVKQQARWILRLEAGDLGDSAHLQVPVCTVYPPQLAKIVRQLKPFVQGHVPAGQRGAHCGAILDDEFAYTEQSLGYPSPVLNIRLSSALLLFGCGVAFAACGQTSSQVSSAPSTAAAPPFSSKPAVSGAESSTSGAKPSGSGTGSAKPVAAGSNAGGTDSALRTIVVAIPATSVAHLPAFVARDAGIYQRHGLQATITNVQAPL